MIGFLRKQSDNFFLFNRYPVTKQFTKFCVVGVTNAVVDVSGYFILTRVFGLYYIISAVLSAIVAITWSFNLNRRWTFKSSPGNLKKQYFNFLVFNVISLALSLFLLYVAVDILGIFDILAKVFITVIVAFINFSLNRIWTFSGHHA